MRQLLALVVFTLILQACSHSPSSNLAASKQAAQPDPALYDQIVIVGTNDFHGYLRPTETAVAGEKVISGGAEWFAGYINILQKKFGDHLIMLDGGDMFQGTIDSNTFQGKSVVDFYNQLPYRAVAVGNHEFDYGAAKEGDKKDRLGALKARMRQAKYPFVQANIYVAKSGRRWREKNLFPSVLVNAGPYKVGIIGLTTTHTAATTLPKNVSPLEFRDFEAPTIEQAKKLRADGADFVFITTHEGSEKPDSPIFNLLKALPAGTIDAVVAGHTHTEIHQFVHGVPVIESKTRGLFFGRIDLFVNKQTRRIDPALTKIHDMHSICGTWFKGSEACDPKAANDALASGKSVSGDFIPLRPATYEGETVRADAKIHKILAPYFAEADKRRKQVLGEAKKDFEYYPSGENQMGTLLLDSFHARFPEAKVIYLNGGGIRRRIFKGTITYGDLFEVSPFDNYAVLVKVTGAQLKELVRVGTSGAHGIPAVWGIKIQYSDKDDPAFDRDVDGNGKKEKWERNRLDPVNGVVWEKTGKPVSDSETFWLGTIDYLVTGGDNAVHVFKGIPDSQKRYFPIGPRDLMAEYLKKKPGLMLPKVEPQRVHTLSGAGSGYEH